MYFSCLSLARIGGRLGKDFSLLSQGWSKQSLADILLYWSLKVILIIKSFASGLTFFHVSSSLKKSISLLLFFCRISCAELPVKGRLPASLARHYKNMHYE